MNAYTFDFPDGDMTAFTKERPTQYDRYQRGQLLLLYIPDKAHLVKNPNDTPDVWRKLECGFRVGYVGVDGGTYLQSGVEVEATHWTWLPTVEPGREVVD